MRPKRATGSRKLLPGGVFVCFLLAWGVDFRPFLFLIGLPLVALIACSIRWFAPRPVRWIAALLSVLSIYSAVFWFVFYGPFVGVEQNMTFPMTWRMGEPGYQASKQAHVLLQFRDYPDHHVGIFSDDVAHYLRGLGSDVVDVTFEVTTDWGRTRGFREVRIGNLTSWRSEGEYAGCIGSVGQAPRSSPFP
jgi:hypothetical protein